MAIEFKKSSVSGRAPIFWRGEAKVLPGGFKPAQTFPIGILLYRGTPLFVDYEARTAAVCKTATVLDGGTTTAMRVAKGHNFVVGDVITNVGGTATPAVKSIDTTNPSYDVITTASAVTGLKAGDVIVETVADGDEKGKPRFTPNAVAAADHEFDGKGLPTIDAAYEALVLYKNAHFPLVAEWLAGNCLKSNPNIMFITQ